MHIMFSLQFILDELQIIILTTGGSRVKVVKPQFNVAQQGCFPRQMLVF